MRIDEEQFRKTICKKCKRYYHGKLEKGGKK